MRSCVFVRVGVGMDVGVGVGVGVGVRMGVGVGVGVGVRVGRGVSQHPCRDARAATSEVRQGQLLMGCGFSKKTSQLVGDIVHL